VYDKYLDRQQISLRDYIKNINLRWSFFLTLRYPLKVSDKRAIRDMKNIERHIRKVLRTQTIYLAIHTRAKYNDFSHTHALIHTKRFSDIRDRLDLFMLNGYIAKHFRYVKGSRYFPHNHSYKLEVIKDCLTTERTYNESMERISQYLIKLEHQTDDSYFLITSQPKKFKKYLRS